MTSQTGKQTITKHILSNISRSKSNQKILSDNRIGNEKHFFEKITHKMWTPDPFVKNRN